MIHPVHFVKGSDGLIEGLGMPYYGPDKGADGIGRDLEGEFFSPRTDFLFDWFPGERPLLYQHTWDAQVGIARLGGVKAFERRDQGVWVRTQLDLRSQWYEAIKELVEREALSFSSGAYPPGVIVAKSGEIVRWPWVELTLTPTPMNPYASLAAAKALEGIALPPSPRRRLTFLGKAAWSAQFIADLPDSAFACIDAAGRHYPHHNAQGELDLPHLRAALSRLGDPRNVQCGRRHLEAHARVEGVGE